MLGVEIAHKREECKLYLSQRQNVINKLDELLELDYVICHMVSRLTNLVMS